MDAVVSDNRIELLESKAGYLTEMLDMTLVFNKAANHGIDKAEEYVSLLDRREALLDKIKQIDDKLKGSAQGPGGSSPVKPEGIVEKRIRDIVDEIFEADRALTILAGTIRSGLLKTIKKINEGKATTQLYDELKTLNTTQFDKRH